MWISVMAPTGTKPTKQEVFVALSGGVDSAMAAALLQEQGHKIRAVFMRNWMDDDGTPECTALQDWMDAQRVCEHLGIELQQVNFSDLYKEKVFHPFLRALADGLTPNPDVLCNHFIKFRAFRHYAEQQGARWMATGHYARLASRGETSSGQAAPYLYCAYDKTKCQTYFLFAVPSFAHCLMPLGNLTKKRVREQAKKRGLPNHAKKDSTGLCFIGERNFSRFISRYLEDQPGDIIDTQGGVHGHHRGLFHHTIGQRQGLGIGGRKGLEQNPWYVVAKDRRKNRLIVAQGASHPSLYTSMAEITDLHWINETPRFPLSCQAKIRYRMQSVPCAVTASADKCRLVFDEPQRAVTAGQAAVLYQEEKCLGGGFIASTARQTEIT